MHRVVIAIMVGMTLWGTAVEVSAQATPEARDLVKEGVSLYDAGNYDAAVAKYQQALRVAPNDAMAQAELALTYHALGKYTEAIALCQELVKRPESDPTIYVTYGNSLDALKKPEEAIRVYQEGVRKYPDNSQLYFNQGITLAGMNKNAEAITSLQQAARLNPAHPSSPLYMGLLTADAGNRVPALLEIARFLVLEPQGRRAVQNLPNLQKLLHQGVTQRDEKNITITLNSSALRNSKRQSKQPDDFSSVEMLLSLIVANEHTEKLRDKTPLEKFSHSFATLCQGLAEQQGKHTGFAWEYYVPYFVAMEKAGFVPAFTYQIHAADAANTEAQQWLAQHPNEVAAFQEWSRTYSWPK